MHRQSRAIDAMRAGANEPTELEARLWDGRGPPRHQHSTVGFRAVSDSRIAKWQRWLDDRIRPDLVTVYAYRDTFNELVRIAAENEQLPDSYFWDFLRGTYAVSQAVAVRRQADVDPRTITLGRLLAEITSDAPRLTRKFWVGMWEPGPPPIGLTVAEKAFTEQWAGNAGNHLDPAIPHADLADLRSKTDAVRRPARRA
jgi:hypothetical protein